RATRHPRTPSGHQEEQRPGQPLRSDPEPRGPTPTARRPNPPTWREKKPAPPRGRGRFASFGGKPKSGVDLLHQHRVERRDLGVHTRVAGAGAAVTPGHDADQLATGDQRTTGVTLAGVDAALGVAGAHLTGSHE